MSLIKMLFCGLCIFLHFLIFSHEALSRYLENLDLILATPSLAMWVDAAGNPTICGS